MSEQIISLVEELLADNEIDTYDEAATSQTMVESVLRILAWNTNHRYEVYPQYPVFEKTNEMKRVDFSLRHENTDKVFIEVKRVGEPLADEYRGQLLRCSSEHGVRLAVLTDGVIWMFYLPMYECEQELDKNFDIIDLRNQEPGMIAERFIDYLSKDNVITGRAVEKAQQMLDKQRNFMSEIGEWIRRLAQEHGIDVEKLTVEITCLHNREFVVDTHYEGNGSDKVATLINKPLKSKWGKTKLIDEEGKETFYGCPSSIAKRFGLRINGRRDMVDVFERPLLNEDGRPSPHKFAVDAVEWQHFYVTKVKNT